jgi:predicted 3-demethylubiquinone-9 3-methyltransferase (glyoxalase superfamily)
MKITPFLWFDDKEEEAAKFYTSIFKNSKIGKISRYGKEGYEVHRRPAGTVMTVEFQIEGEKFTALNGGPQFKFRGRVILCRLQNTGGSGRAVGEAHRWRRRRIVRLA